MNQAIKSISISLIVALIIAIAGLEWKNYHSINYDQPTAENLQDAKISRNAKQIHINDSLYSDKNKAQNLRIRKLHDNIMPALNTIIENQEKQNKILERHNVYFQQLAKKDKKLEEIYNMLENNPRLMSNNNINL